MFNIVLKLLVVVIGLKKQESNIIKMGFKLYLVRLVILYIIGAF